MLTNRVEIFFSHQGNRQPLYLQSGDENSRYLELRLLQFDGTTFVEIDTADHTATMVYSYRNTSGPQATGDITAERQEDGTFLTLIPIDPLLQTGEVKAQLSLRKTEDGQLMKSAVLIINVLQSLTADAEYTEQAVTQLTAILAQIDEAVQAAEGAAQATADALAAAAAANEAAGNAEQAADDADDSAALANLAAQDADDAAALANQAAQGADASAAAANQAASDANAAAGLANQAAQGADASAAAASQAASDANNAADAADQAASDANTAAGAANAAAAQAIAAKTSIKTVDEFTDYATLLANVPSPTPYTDYYAVGAAEPYDIYVYTASGWLNLGPIGGASATLAILADAYNSSSTYALKEYCIQDNKFYECTTPITTPEAWTSEHWTERTIGYVLKALDEAKADLGVVEDEYNPASTYVLGKFCIHDGTFNECTTAIETPEAWNAAHWTQRTIGYVLKALDDAKADLGVVEDEYNPASTYVLGKFCIHNGTFNECTTAIETPEAWNAAHWTQRTIGYVLKALNDGKATAAQGAKADNAADFVTIAESSNVFPINTAGKEQINCAIAISDTNGKTITASNVATRCAIFIEITLTATAPIIWTLDGGSIVWVTDNGDPPSATSGHILKAWLETNNGGTKWIAAALPEG